jgi:hypothetical protein
MAKIPIAVQLYSVRKDFQADPAGTIKAVAKMGYQGVEFAGYADRSAKELRKMLDDTGLKCCGTHIGIETLLGDEFEEDGRVQPDARQPSHRPGLPATTPAAARRGCRTAVCRDRGQAGPLKMKTGYHNHHTKFKPLDGEPRGTPSFGNTKKSVVMQYGVGNACYGGGGA